MCITDLVVNLQFFIRSRKVVSNSRSDQLVTFTSGRHEALPIDDLELASTALNQARTFHALR